MFSTSEENYLKGLISVYAKQGYKYYLCHTVTENNNDYDVYIYFSKEEIKAITQTAFDISNSIFIKLDSSTRNSYNDNNHRRIVVSDSNYSSVVSVHEAEFIYSNAVADYDTSTLVVNPDIIFNGSSSYEVERINCLTCFTVFVIFLYIFVTDLLRFRR